MKQKGIPGSATAADTESHKEPTIGDGVVEGGSALGTKRKKHEKRQPRMKRRNKSNSGAKNVDSNSQGTLEKGAPIGAEGGERQRVRW